MPGDKAQGSDSGVCVLGARGVGDAETETKTRWKIGDRKGQYFCPQVNYSVTTSDTLADVE